MYSRYTLESSYSDGGYVGMDLGSVLCVCTENEQESAMHMCMSVELNGELEVLLGELRDVSMSAYGDEFKGVDLEAEKVYYEVLKKIEAHYTKMSKFDQHLGEQLRKKHLKEKLGVE